MLKFDRLAADFGTDVNDKQWRYFASEDAYKTYMAGLCGKDVFWESWGLYTKSARFDDVSDVIALYEKPIWVSMTGVIDAFAANSQRWILEQCRRVQEDPAVCGVYADPDDVHLHWPFVPACPGRDVRACPGNRIREGFFAQASAWLEARFRPGLPLVA